MFPWKLDDEETIALRGAYGVVVIATDEWPLDFLRKDDVGAGLLR